jgi:hypothetical protein
MLDKTETLCTLGGKDKIRRRWGETREEIELRDRILK